MKIVINPKYRQTESFINRLAQPGWFNSPENGTVLHSGRNSVKMFKVNGLKLVVKSYGHLSAVNRLIYGRLRKSKAQRAYEFAERLLNLGVNTPENVAYIEKRHKGLLSESYFVCLHTDFLSMPQSFRAIEDGTEEFDKIIPLLNDLTIFLYKIHEAGVLHNDLNFTNILYNKYPDRSSTAQNQSNLNTVIVDSGSTEKRGRYANYAEYQFTIIDINRMQFRKKLSIEERLHNLRRISLSVPAHTYILRQYAGLIGQDPATMERFGLGLRKTFEQKRKKNARVKEFVRGRK